MSAIRRTALQLWLLSLVVFLAGLAASKSPSADAAGTFSPSGATTLTSTAAGANADTQVTFNIAAPDYAAHLVVSSVPAAAFVAPGPSNPAFVSGTHPGLGDVVGTLSATITTGQNNGLCNTPIALSFTLLNATTDTNDVIQPVPASATNPGDGGALASLWSDDGASTAPSGMHLSSPPWNDPGGWADAGATTPALTAGEQANRLPAQVDDYPGFLNGLFTPDGGSPVQPLARYAGAADVNGTVETVNVLVFAPNALANAFLPTHPFHDLRDIGHTVIAVFANRPAPGVSGGMGEEPSTVTDQCTPTTSTATFFGMALVNRCATMADPCSSPASLNQPSTTSPVTTFPRYSNPSNPGTHFWVSFYQSQRDLDSDGKENQLDTCPVNADLHDPRTGGGFHPDSDADGIPDICDANGSASPDADSDGWLSRGDNCPQNANPTQVESEASQAYVQAARRGGPKTDGLGDPCDNLGSNTADGRFHTRVAITPVCVGDTDADNDGWCANDFPEWLADPNDNDGGRVREDYLAVFPMPVAHAGSGPLPPMREPAQVCNDGIDNDGDGYVDSLDWGYGVGTCSPKQVQSHPGYPSCPSTGCPPIDSDGDGYTDEAEILIGTDPLGRCGLGDVPYTSTHWPSDLVSNGIPNSTDRTNLLDMTSFLAPVRRLNTSPGDPEFSARWDLFPGTGLFVDWIAINDLTNLIAGPSGFPPMFSGNKAFGIPLCAAHPVYGE